jgi:hypothetical protein
MSADRWRALGTAQSSIDGSRLLLNGLLVVAKRAARLKPCHHNPRTSCLGSATLLDMFWLLPYLLDAVHVSYATSCDTTGLMSWYEQQQVNES